MLFTKSSGTGRSSGGRSCTRMSQSSAGELEGGKGQEAQHHLAAQALLHNSYLETLGQLNGFGCFSGSRDRGGLYFHPKNTKTNGKRYKMVCLLPFMRIHRSSWFLQNSAPSQKSQVVMVKLKEMEKDVYLNKKIFHSLTCFPY